VSCPHVLSGHPYAALGSPDLSGGGMAPEGRAEQGTKKFPARPDVGRCPGLARGETTVAGFPLSRE